MVVEKWVREETIYITPGLIERALGELNEEAEKIKYSAESGKNWEAYMTLVNCVSFFNMAGEQLPSKRPEIINCLLKWFPQIGDLMAKIVKGIGGNGYIIGASCPFGISISISFPS